MPVKTSCFATLLKFSSFFPVKYIFPVSFKVNIFLGNCEVCIAQENLVLNKMGYFVLERFVAIVPTDPKIYKWLGFCLIASFHSFDTEKEKYFILIVLWSDAKFAPFKLKSLCFTQGMRNRGAALGHSEDELHRGFSGAGGREMWLQSSPNLWVCKTPAAGKEMWWSSSAKNVHRLNSLLLCDGLSPDPVIVQQENHFW